LPKPAPSCVDLSVAEKFLLGAAAYCYGVTLFFPAGLAASKPPPAIPFDVVILLLL
jgi:hypothetical protein